MKCKVCKGSGKVTLTVTEFGKPGETKSEIDCVHCKGTGQMTAKQAADHKAMEDFWCKCGNPSEETEYYEYADGTHGWTCKDCGKVVQVG